MPGRNTNGFQQAIESNIPCNGNLKNVVDNQIACKDHQCKESDNCNQCCCIYAFSQLCRGIAPVYTNADTVFFSPGLPGIAKIQIYLLHLSPDIQAGCHHHIQVGAEGGHSRGHALGFHCAGVFFGNVYIVNRADIIIIPPANQGESVRFLVGQLVLVAHGIGQCNFRSQLRLNAQQLQCCRVHGDFFPALGHMSGCGFCETPLGAVFVHAADFRRDFRKNAAVHESDRGAYTHSLHLGMAGNGLCLLLGHFLKGTVAVAAHLAEGVILIAGIDGHYDGKQRGK